VIRRLAGDAAAACSDEIARILYAAFDAPGQRWSAGSVAATLAMPGTVALLARDACAILRVAADEAEILTIAVLPLARGQGRAAGLVHACIAEAAAAGAMRMHLDVAGSNAAARALYLSAGFAETGRRPGYYRGPAGREDAILMAREIAGPIPGEAGR
jgi:[ribosomal protein S18]-alanine N-acetyltransferase